MEFTLSWPGVYYFFSVFRTFFCLAIVLAGLWAFTLLNEHSYENESTLNDKRDDFISTQ